MHRLQRPATPHRRAIVGLLAPFGLLFALTYVFPIGYAIYQSLLKTQRTGLFGTPRLVFGGLGQYRVAFANGEFWRGVGRVLVLGVTMVPIMLGLALLFALVIDSLLAKGRRFFRLAFFVPYAVPSVVASIVWVFLLTPSLSPFAKITGGFNFFDPSIVLFTIGNVVIWIYTGFNMLILYSALHAIPVDYYEAARLDGAGQFRIAWSVKIPLIAPAVILTMVLSVIGTLQLFNEPQLFQASSYSVTSTFTPNMAIFATMQVPNYNLAAAMSVVLAVTTGILSFSFLKVVQKRAFTS